MPNGRSVLVLKYCGQEADGEHRHDRRDDRGEDRRAADAGPLGAGQVRELVEAGEQDRRRRQQEREMGRVGVVQATGQPRGHAHAVTGDPRDQGGRLADADHRRLAVLERRQSPGALAVQPLALGQRVNLGAAPVFLGVEQDAAVDHQEDRRRQGLGERVLQRRLQGQGDQADRDRRADDQPRQPLVGRLDPSLGERPEERADDLDPVAPRSRTAGRPPSRRGASPGTPSTASSSPTARRRCCASETASGSAPRARGWRSGTAR